MLRFTRQGVVQGPTNLQIRLGPSLGGRVQAGAPAPQRALQVDEVLTNLEHFTSGLRGPRTRPCDRLVLSCLDVLGPDSLAHVVRSARAMGLRTITGHVDGHALQAGLPAGLDAVAVVARSPEHALALPRRPDVSAVVVLDHNGLAQLAPMANALLRSRPTKVVLTWPLASSTPPPAASDVVPELVRVVAQLEAAGITVGIKGLPLCAVPSLSQRAWRTHNRWYVDSEHQLDRAILFMPGVVQFHKDDVCRYCVADARCDGVVERWLNEGLVGPLQPFTHEPPAHSAKRP